jgi:flavorubredoxin
MGTLVLAAASYDGDVFPPMHEFLHHLQLKGYRSRRVAIIENGSWAPSAARAIKAMLEPLKEIEIIEPVVTIRSRMKQSDMPALERLAEQILK